jgi:flagellar hook assembly protein FlgD
VADTEIRFEIARTGPVSIKVYNAMGQLVRTLVDERRDPGRYSIRWDGRNQAGERVSSGVFFYSMKAERFSETKKMLVVR